LFLGPSPLDLLQLTLVSCSSISRIFPRQPSPSLSVLIFFFPSCYPAFAAGFCFFERCGRDDVKARSFTRRRVAEVFSLPFLAGSRLKCNFLLSPRLDCSMSRCPGAHSLSPLLRHAHPSFLSPFPLSIFCDSLRP